MDESLLKLAKKRFLEALDRPPDERERFLDACGDDAPVRRQVEALLRWDRGAASAFLQGTGLDVAAGAPSDGADAAPARMVGRRVAGFTIERPIASGGMGSVYVATQDRPRRPVALKLMRAGVASPSSLRRFEREAQVLGKLRHPHIAQVYEAGTYDDGSGGAPYFAMEYVPDARSITKHAEAEGLGTRERLELFANVCDAVHHGHEHGVIHRDLKPSNILVDAAGVPKVIDFGVAKATDSDLAVTTLRTDVGELVGTLQYMSPEQCAGECGDLDARSDVYALGIVLYELLCGALPYDVSGVSIPEAARVIQGEAPTKPSTVNRTLRGDVETIALKALEKDRVRRYASAAELGRDIGRYLRGEGIEARPPSALYRARTLARRHRVASAVIALLLVAGPLLAVATAQALRSSTRARGLDERLATVSAIDLGGVDRQAVGRSWSGIERAVDEAVRAFMREHVIPGATVAISKDARLVHSKGYGFAVAGRRIQMQPWHRSRIDGLSNALLITPSLFKLIESSPDVDLDTPLYGPGGVFEDEPFLDDIEIGIAGLAPEDRDRQRAWYRSMTLRHVLTGTAGFVPGSFSRQEHYVRQTGSPVSGVTLRSLHRKVLRNHPLRHEPGKGHAPPGRTGHLAVLLGLAVADLSGMPYVEYVEENVLEPFGLRGSVGHEGAVGNERDALPHAVVGRQSYVVALETPYRGWVASARDIVLLMTAVDGLDTPPDIISEASIEKARRLAAGHPRPLTWWTRPPNARGDRKYVRTIQTAGGTSCVVMFPAGYVSDSGTDLSQIMIAVCANVRLSSNTVIEKDLADRIATLVGEASIPASFDLWDDEPQPPTPLR